MKNVVICCPLDEEGLKTLERVKETNLLKGANVHLVHCFETQMYSYAFMAAYYPSEEQFQSIEESVNGILNDLQAKIKSAGDDNTQWSNHVFKGPDPKREMVKYLEEAKADIAVVSTKGHHGVDGLFHSSFAEYMLKHAPSDLTVLRPH